MENNIKDVYLVHIPKTAGMFITNVLKNELKDRYVGCNVVNTGGHLFMKLLLKKISDINFSDVYKITIIRCPIKRFISAYFYLKNNLNNTNFETVKDEFQKNNITSFSSLINLLKTNYNSVYNLAESFYPQYKWITDDERNIIVD